MIDEPLVPEPDIEQAPGWQVIDPDGNVVDSGPVMQLEAASDAGPAGPEEEQEQ